MRVLVLLSFLKVAFSSNVALSSISKDITLVGTSSTGYFVQTAYFSNTDCTGTVTGGNVNVFPLGNCVYSMTGAGFYTIYLYNPSDSAVYSNTFYQGTNTGTCNLTPAGATGTNGCCSIATYGSSTQVLQAYGKTQWPIQCQSGQAYGYLATLPNFAYAYEVMSGTHTHTPLISYILLFVLTYILSTLFSRILSCILSMQCILVGLVPEPTIVPPRQWVTTNTGITRPPPPPLPPHTPSHTYYHTSSDTPFQYTPCQSTYSHQLHLQSLYLPN